MTDGLDAALTQLSSHAERIAVLDERELGHFREIGERLTDLGTRLAALHGTVAGQSEILRSLDGLDDTVRELTGRLAGILPDDDGDASPAYRPQPMVRWWSPPADEQARAERAGQIAALRNWVEEIYRPMYGKVSGSLGPCWPQHDFCLITLDWFHSLWCALHLIPRRGVPLLQAQAEFQTRYLPAVAGQLAAETSNCPHAMSRGGGRRTAVSP